ncbi:MAG: SEC-C domain-containing protein [Pseudomonadota bacterium]|nr:MAG: SEC-C domain-containing protein [Pseudomonadota bacterium]
MTHEFCPCGSGQLYTDCCGRYLDGGEQPATAAQLMRSRYTAYVRGNESWLRTTWHPTTCPATLDPTAQGPVKWLGLKVVRVVDGSEADTQGIVEFVARYKVRGRAQRMHEVSRFRREQGRWFYVDGAPGAG